MVGFASPMTVADTAMRARVVPLALAVGPPTLAVVALCVQLAAGAELLANYLIVDVSVGVVSAVLGAFLIARIPDNAMGWLFALSGSAYAVTAGVTAWVTGALAWGWPGLSVAAWVSEWAYVLALGPQITLLLLLFPDGRPPTRRWRFVAWASTTALVGLVVAFMLVPQAHIDDDRLVGNPIGGTPLADAAVGPLLLLLGGCALASAAGLAVRLWRAGNDERRRIAPYVGTAVVVVAVFAAVGAAPPIWEPIAQTVVLPLLPVAATVCIVRYRLYDLEVVVRRSLVWLGLTAVVVLGYALVVEATANLLRREAGLPESLIATGALAAVFQPTRVWLQRLVGRVLYGHRHDPDVALTSLGQSLSMTAQPEAALEAASRRLAESLALPWVAVEVRRDAAEPYRTESGQRPTWATDEQLTTVALIHAGAEQGVLRACRRGPKEALSSRDRGLLESLGYPIAATAAAFRLTDDLQRSRERIVLAREEERRQLRHDLHDDLAPLLASFTLQLDAALLRQSRTGETPSGVLRELRSTATDAVVTVRRAVEHLRPPSLGEFGLEAAVTEAAKRLRTPDGPRIEVEFPRRLPPLPATTEAAAHRIATEGLTNAMRHAGASVVRLRVDTTEPHLLVVEVRDDGAGIAADHRAGVGTVSMRARAEELGGRCDITAAGPGPGTLVRAVLPLGGQR